MPLVRIDIAAGMPVDYRKAIGDVIYDAMRSTLNIPPDDRFQIISEHQRENFIVDPTFLGIERTNSCIVIQVTLNDGRALDVKCSFYKAVVSGLVERLKTRPQDVFINLVEVRRENWSFGNGEAQFAEVVR